ncbi:hypothetical protein V2A60_009710 [Cordyceps javanica]
MLALSLLLGAATGVYAYGGSNVTSVQIGEGQFFCTNDCTYNGAYFTPGGSYCRLQDVLALEGGSRSDQVRFTCPGLGLSSGETERPLREGESPQQCEIVAENACLENRFSDDDSEHKSAAQWPVIAEELQQATQNGQGNSPQKNGQGSPQENWQGSSPQENGQGSSPQENGQDSPQENGQDCPQENGQSTSEEKDQICDDKRWKVFEKCMDDKFAQYPECWNKAVEAKKECLGSGIAETPPQATQNGQGNSPQENGQGSSPEENGQGSSPQENEQGPSLNGKCIEEGQEKAIKCENEGTAVAECEEQAVQFILKCQEQGQFK